MRSRRLAIACFGSTRGEARSWRSPTRAAGSTDALCLMLPTPPGLEATAVNGWAKQRISIDSGLALRPDSSRRGGLGLAVAV